MGLVGREISQRSKETKMPKDRERVTVISLFKMNLPVIFTNADRPQKEPV